MSTRYDDVDFDSMRRDLEAALANDEFHLVYQPVLDAFDCVAVGAEALLRWRHPVWDDMSPRIFFPVAERIGLTRALTERILRGLCRQGANWIVEGGDTLNLSANVSAAQLADPGLPEIVAGALQDTGFPVERLQLEISESALVPDMPHLEHVILALKKLGVTIVLDDFGERRGCFSALKRVRADAVKISAALIREGVHDRHATAVIQAMRTYGQERPCDLTVKGVENEEQIAFVHHQGIRFVQGFSVCRPLDPGDLPRWCIEASAPCCQT